MSTRRTLGTITAPSSIKPAQPPPAQKWGEGVRGYVQRAFAADNAIPGVTAEEMQSKLRDIINGAAEKDKVNEVVWETLPTPQEIIVAERNAALSGVQQKTVWQENLSGLQLQSLSASLPSDPIHRKRKIDDNAMEIETPDTTTTQPPWRAASTRNVFEDRLSFPTLAEASKKTKDKKQKNESKFGKDVILSTTDLEKRRQRFEADRVTHHSTYDTSRDDTPLLEAHDGPVIGTCLNLEKNYFRLTAPPKPETVRPLPILQKTLAMLKTKWRQENNYAYTCDQFKSLRQDLTVQHIKNEFTVKVYETHARIALQKMDLGEYNQCQTQLRALYKQNLGGNPAEFLAYRILYFIYTCNRPDMNDVLSELTQTVREEPAVKHALEVRSALASGNYHRFFRLFLDPPNMGAYMMDMFIERERIAALANISRA